MSRVDDDRDAARVAERIALQKRQEEAKAKARAGESAFSKLIAQGPNNNAPAKASQTADGNPPAHPDSPPPPPKGFASKLGRPGELGQKARLGEQQTTEGRQRDQGVSRGKTESRREDAKVTEKFLKERGGEDDDATVGASDLSVRGGRGKGELKTDTDAGGGGSGDGKQDDKNKGGELAAGFRFNPALMAPVPVAKPKDTARSERLRAVANEIAQKIVERVRVGTNATGKAEMQIELRSSVLSGLSIKIAAHNGKISAVFSGSNKEVLAMLKEQGETLKQTLEGRGLRLEEFRVEEKA